MTDSKIIRQGIEMPGTGDRYADPDSGIVEVTDFERTFPKGTYFRLVCDEGTFGYESCRDNGKDYPALPARNSRNTWVTWKRLSTAKKWLKIAETWAADPYEGVGMTRPRIIAYLPR